MNVLVCGTKEVTPRSVVYGAIEGSGFVIDVLGSAGTAGAAQAAITYAREKRIRSRTFGPLSRAKSGPGNPSDMEDWTEAIVLVGENPPETRAVLEHAEAKGLPIHREGVTA